MSDENDETAWRLFRNVLIGAILGAVLAAIRVGSWNALPAILAWVVGGIVAGMLATFFVDL